MDALSFLWKEGEKGRVELGISFTTLCPWLVDEAPSRVGNWLLFREDIYIFLSRAGDNNGRHFSLSLVLAVPACLVNNIYNTLILLCAMVIGMDMD